MKPKIVLSLDDFYSCNHQFAKLDKLNDHFDNFKITVFSVATCMPEDWVRFDVLPRKYLSLAIHGYYHTFWECHYWSEVTAIKSITDAEEAWTIKGFKAPFWMDSDGTLAACKKLGYWVALNKDEPPYSRLPNGLPIYIHDADIAHIPDKWDKPYLKLHGHVQNVCGNGLAECFDNLIKLPKNTEFVWIDDYMKAGGDKSIWTFRDDIPYDCYSLAIHAAFAGSMPQLHVEKLWDIAKKEGGPVLEIGAGASTVLFGIATGEIWSSDVNYNQWFPINNLVLTHQFNFKGIGGPSGDPNVLANIPRDFKASILFIDGGHTKNDILQDFGNYSGFVKDGGLIIFHDTNHKDYPGIIEAVKLIETQNPIKLEDEIVDTHGLRVYRK